MLLILAGVSISGLFSPKGLFKRTEDASNRYNESKAREVLETVLLADGQYEKNTNPEYNQDDFLDELIKSEIPGSDVKGDVAIIGEYGYELDRSVPKIGRYLGKASDLVWPTIKVSEPVLADNYRTATFTVTSIEGKKGINKIEIWFAGEKIETLTKTYDNVKTEIKENFTVNRNGTYTIKAYGELWASVTVKVTGIVPAVEFSPNGSLEWKKEHTTKIIVKETGERVTNLKYKWTTSKANEPAKEEFTENCPADNIITAKDFTGTYYLWVLLTTETGKTNICGSEGFNFDNEAPTVELTSTPTSEISFILTATASDTESGISRYEFYVDGVKVDSQTTNSNIATYEWNGTGMVESKKCYVIVVDKAGNFKRFDFEARTKLYSWERWSVIKKTTYKDVILETKDVSFSVYYQKSLINVWKNAKFNPEINAYCLSNGRTQDLYYDGNTGMKEAWYITTTKPTFIGGGQGPEDATSPYIWKYKKCSREDPKNNYRPVTLTLEKHISELSTDISKGTELLGVIYSVDSEIYKAGFSEEEDCWYVASGIK